ncbi:putative leader peptide [Streptomyces sp. B1866]|nr:putative leader peptide [Streptomyces sp. B1866]MDT3400317.1 putative leader peptide [Streptomyces sp. B1866]
MAAAPTPAHRVRRGTSLVARRHVDLCRTASAI